MTMQRPLRRKNASNRPRWLLCVVDLVAASIGMGLQCFFECIHHIWTCLGVCQVGFSFVSAHSEKLFAQKVDCTMEDVNLNVEAGVFVEVSEAVNL